MHTAAERGGINQNGFKDFPTENNSSQGQSLALTGLRVPRLRDSGRRLHILIIIIIYFLFKTLTCHVKPAMVCITLICNVEPAMVKSSFQIYCFHGRLELSKAYTYHQRNDPRQVNVRI